MKKICSVPPLLAVLIAFGWQGGFAGAAPALPALRPANLPLYFEANQGQADSPTRFIAHGRDSLFLISPDVAQLVLSKTSVSSSSARSVKMQFAGADDRAQISGAGELSGKINYFVGNDPAQWRTGIATFAQVQVNQLYPGVNLDYHGNQRRLEYDFTVAPGADPGCIAICFDGADKVSINPAGELVLNLGDGEIVQPKPLVYQTVHGARREVNGGYKMLDSRTVAFAIGNYDHRLPLVIDPIMSYATYFGGNGADTAWAVVVDPNDGSVYVAGQTTSTQFKNWTIPPGAVQSNFQGGSITGDAFIAKLDKLGTNLLYLTYLGGSGEDLATAITVDGAGNSYLAGATTSPNFPTTTNAPGRHISGTATSAGYSFDAFVAKLNPGGSHLLFSTYLGGVASDGATAIALDSSNDIYVTGYTYSTNFPVTMNAFQKHLAVTNWAYQAYYNANAFVTEVSVGNTNLVYSSYFGGTNFDAGEGIAVDQSNGIYVDGFTGSVNFPNTNSFQKYLNGSTNATTAYDAFVAKFSPGFSNLEYSTFLGGTNNDVAYRLAVDGSGKAYLTGWTASSSFPDTVNLAGLANGLTNNAVYGYPVTTNAFLAQIVWNGTNAGIGYSAVFGGTNLGIDIGYGVALDPAGDAFVVGTTTSTNFPANAPNALAATNAGGFDAFVTAFSTNAGSLLYSGCLGGAANDYGYAIAADPAGNAYIVGQTLSANFPTNGARQAALNGPSDAFLAKIILTVLPPDIITQPTSQTVGAGSTVTFGAGFTGTPPFGYQWQMQETNLTWTNLVNNSGLTAASNVSLTISDAQMTNSGNYQVIVTNYAGSVTSSVAVLFVTNFPVVITQQPLSQTVGAASTVTLGVNVTGTPPLYFQWQDNGTNLVNGTNASGSVISGATNATLTISNAQLSDSSSNYLVIVSNSVNTAVSSNAALTVVIGPTITQQPTNQTVASGSYMTLAVAAAGEGALHYRWQVQPTNQPGWMEVTNGGNISGATNTVLSLYPAYTTNSGYYQVVITNNFGMVTSAVALLTVTNVPVVITRQPVSQTNGVGSTVQFIVQGDGTEVSFQWFKNGGGLVNGTNASGSVIKGATDSNVLEIDNAQTNDSGNYSIIVSNSVSSATSSNAVLLVVAAPTIVVPPTNQIAGLGAVVNFSVTAAGLEPLSYRWLMDGTNAVGGPISGANTNATLTLTNTQIGDSGRSFSVIVTNLVGAVTSSPPAILTVLTAPRFTSVTSEGGTNFSINGVGGTNSGAFNLLTTTNLALPLTNWTSLGSNTFNSQGGFGFTYSQTNVPLQQFFILQMQSP